LLLTVLWRSITIPVALNKKSAQKQKDKQQKRTSRKSFFHIAALFSYRDISHAFNPFTLINLLARTKLCYTIPGYMEREQNVISLVDSGQHGLVVRVECAMSNSLPGIVIVGYANKAVDEARERIRSAFASSKLDLPRKRITINLAPADIPKDGSSFDLAVATAVLTASHQIKDPLTKTAIMGELGLDGSVRPIRGVIGKIMVGLRHGITRFIIPAGNMDQAVLVPNAQLIAVSSLRELHQYLNGADHAPVATAGNSGITMALSQEVSTEIDEVIGQELGKRAVEISAAGGHNLLLGGPPGTGKSMLARTLPELLPPLSREEMLEVTQLHSLASNDFEQIITSRPFRSPHHSASSVSIIGGGTRIRPGELSLAHRGVLLFDELPEFGRTLVEALRQPLETRQVTIARAKDSVDYPAHFIFVATANPCPCGYYQTSKPCRCLPHQVVAYRRKLSGPILDRIDLYVDVHEIDNSQLLSARAAESTAATIKARIAAARKRQAARFTAVSKLNTDMTNQELKTAAKLAKDAKTILDQAANSFGLSARAYMRTVKVARTIADLDDSDKIAAAHIAEALQFRPHAYHA
jgi:magnesium chelatase family protein